MSIVRFYWFSSKILDENYTRVLFENPEIDLETAFLIDRVRKHLPISKDAVKHLRKMGGIEGKSPNIYFCHNCRKYGRENTVYQE